MRLIFKASLIFILFVMGQPPGGHAQDVKVTSTFDRRSADVGEEIRMTIRVTGAEGNVQAPQLPALDGFDTFYTGRASHFTFINNQSTSSVEFNYILVPRQAGHFRLPPVEILVEGRRFRTDPIEIDVSQSQMAPTTTAPTPSRQPAYQPPVPSAPPVQEPASYLPAGDDNIFIRAWVDKTTVYPNEQILLTYSLYTRYDTRYEGFEEEPQLSGFWIEEFPMDRDIRRETVRINGKRYVKADVKKMALFPTTAAHYTIQPGSIKVSIRQEPQSTSVFDEFFNDSFFSGGSFFSRRENRLIRPDPIQITVQPLPKAGQPDSFQGAVGNFRMSAEIDRNQIKQNEPVTMELVIEGEGNVETLNKPKVPQIDGFKIYDADTSSQLYKTGNVIGGRKTFEIVFIPSESGDQRIPKLEFSFFNPASRSYQKLSTPEFKLDVKPSDQPFQLPQALTGEEAFKKKVELEGKDIRFIRERLPAEGPPHVFSFVTRALGGMDILLALLVLAGLWRLRQEKIFAKDKALKRRRFARSRAETGIHKLKGLKRSKAREASAEYFVEIEKVLNQYISDKFNLSPYGMTRSDVEQQLLAVIGDEPLFFEVLELYKMCEQARFAKAQIPKESLERAMRILQDTIKRLEKIR